MHVVGATFIPEVYPEMYDYMGSHHWLHLASTCMHLVPAIIIQDENLP